MASHMGLVRPILEEVKTRPEETKLYLQLLCIITSLLLV